MNVLVLAPYVPFPARTGGRNRLAGLIDAIRRFAHVRVVAVGEASGAELSASRAELGRWGIALDVYPAQGPVPGSIDTPTEPAALAHFRSPELRAALPGILREFPPDVVHFEELVMAQYADAVPAPRVIDRQKVEWVYHEAMAVAEPAARDTHEREAQRFRALESRTAAQFAAALALGDEDRARLAPVYGASHVHVVPITVDDAIQAPADRERRVEYVLLYGALDYAPNVEANEIYFRDVWPKLRDRLPALRTLVVGSGAPPSSLLRHRGPGVEIRGYVPDVAEVLRGPGVLVVPLRTGGGARTKILEALAAGMPVVSNAVGVENLGLQAGTHFLPAETADAIADGVMALVRDPVRADALGRAGAARIDESFRVEATVPVLSTLYGALASEIAAARASRPRRALLIGVRPLPDEADARALSFPGHRTAQFRHALERAGYEVHAVLLDEDPATPAARRADVHVLGPEEFRAGGTLQRVHDDLQPTVVVGAGGYHPVRVASSLVTDRPRWIDLGGDLSAEGQARALAAGDGILPDYLTTLAAALRCADGIYVVGPSQRLAVLGQLGLAGRLRGTRMGVDPVAIVPLAAEAPPAPPPLPEGNLRVLHVGGYNTWMDVDLLFTALERAMAQRPGVVFVSIGGPVPGHDDHSHARFWRRARGSRFAARFEDHGRIPRRAALAALGDAHVVVSASRPCLEAELGSRQRLVEALAHGRAVVCTALGDLAAVIAAEGAGLVVAAGNAEAFGDALARLDADRGLLRACAASARRVWEERLTLDATTASMRPWLQEPRGWPWSVLEPGPSGVLATDRQRLQAELDAIRASYTFRFLRWIDRVLGRAP